MIRVRFAPSPTGFLHIGGVRTALFNYLYARSQQGRFLLRIEDTDRERSTPEFENDILSSMKWLGLQWDEEFRRQSETPERYRRYADELLAKDLAYEETADGNRAVKFRMPKREVCFYDLVHGETRFDAALFEDLVILKSDGFPTYHFACVVDDHDMSISHVIRGDDHLSNTPRQIPMYEALGWKPPKYAHLPLILGEDGTPLSKRHGAVAVRHYREEGFLPEGLLNFLALMGWSPGNDEEIFSLKDLIKRFSLKKINKAGARFNHEKLLWLNAQHIKRMPKEDYREALNGFYADECGRFSPDRWERLAILYQPRIRTFGDLKREAHYLFGELGPYDNAIRDSLMAEPGFAERMQAWVKGAETFGDFTDSQRLEVWTRQTAEAQGSEAKKLIHPLRFAITGQTASPGLFELMSVMGKETCLERVKRFLKQE